MGTHPMKSGSECPLADQWCRLKQWSNITLFLRRTCRDCINLVQKSCQVYSSVLYCMRGESGKETFMIADKEELEEMDASELHARRLSAKEVLTPMKGDDFIFLVADGTVKTLGGDRRLKPPTLIRDRPERGEEQEVFRGESDGLYSLTPLQDDLSRDDAEAKNDFWSITQDFIYRHHVEPRVKLYVPREESFPIPLNYIDVARTTHKSLDVLLEKILMIAGTWMEKANFQMHGQASQDSFYWTKGNLTDMHGPGGDLRGNKQPQDPTMYSQICRSMFWCSETQSKAQQKWIIVR